MDRYWLPKSWWYSEDSYQQPRNYILENPDVKMEAQITSVVQISLLNLVTDLPLQKFLLLILAFTTFVSTIYPLNANSNSPIELPYWQF